MEYAKKNGIEVTEIYADRHISGKSIAGRYEFQRMLDDAQEHKFDCVIVWKIDRFGRDRQDIAVSKLMLKKAGVKLLYAKESVPEGPEGIILEAMLEGIAEYYSADLRQKVLRGRRETLKKGLYCGGTLPIGYLKDDERKLVLDPKSAPLVRTAFEMFAEGKTITECADFLNAHDVHGQRNKSAKISMSAMGRMFRNEKYLGIFDTSGVELRAEPIVTEELFMEVQSKLSTKTHKMPQNSDYLLSCKCYCMECKTMLIGESGTSKSGKKFQYYKCGGRKRGNGCTLPPIGKEELEDLVFQTTVNEMLTDSVIKNLTDQILKVQENDIKDDPAKRIEKALDSCRKKQANILRAIEENPTRGLATRLSDLEREEASLAIELKKAQVRRPRLSMEDIGLWLRSFKNGDVTDEDFCKRLADAFIARVEVAKDTIAIFYNISNKKAQKREIPRCSDISRLVEVAELHPNTPFVVGHFIVLIIKKAV
jgi:DNA invertase Pin-like site-specific DNA recombinase